MRVVNFKNPAKPVLKAIVLGSSDEMWIALDYQKATGTCTYINLQRGYVERGYESLSDIADQYKGDDRVRFFYEGDILSIQL